MTVVFLTSASTSPFNKPGDWADAGHTVELVGCGATGGAASPGASATPGGSGSGGGYGLLTYSSGVTGASVPFAVKAGNTVASQTTNATCWESTTSTNAYIAGPGQQAAALAQAAGGNAASTSGSPTPVTYTLTGAVAGGTSGAGNSGGGGGGGAGGPAAAGGTGGNANRGGGGGSAANNGATGNGLAGAAIAGGNGGPGVGPSHGGGLGSTDPSAPNGTAGIGGQGGGGGAGGTLSNAGQVCTGSVGGPNGNVSNWVQTSDSSAQGTGGGGGGAGGISANVPCTAPGGNGALYGGGGGGAGGCRGSASVVTPGTGASGLIVVTYTGAVVQPIWGWDQQGVGERLSPRQFSRERRAGAVMRGDDGTQAVTPIWKPLGFEHVTIQPRSWPKANQKVAAVLRGDDGTQQTTPVYEPLGFEQVASQEPPVPPRKRGAAFTEDRDDGDYTQTKAPLLAWGYDVQQQPTREWPWRLRIAAMLRGDEGIAVPTPVYEPLGFEEIFSTEPRRRWEKSAGAVTARGDEGIQAVTPIYEPLGFEETSSQDLHQRRERSAATARWLDGIELPMTRPQPWFEAPIQFSLRRVFRAPLEGHPGIESPFVNWIEVGFEQVSAQDRHPRPERSGALARGLDGVDAPLPPSVVAFFDVTASQDRYARTRLGGALMRGVDGIENPLVVFTPDGWTPTSSQDRHPRPERFAALARGLDGIDAPLPPPSIPWFETTPATTFHRLFRSPEFGDPGVVAPYVNWANVAYQVVSQEPHPRRERSGALARGLDGTDAPLPPPPVPWFEFNQPTTLHRLFKSPEFGDSGIAAPYVPFTPLDWPWLAMHRHPRPELSGALARGADGIEFPLPHPLVPWFETTPPLTRHALFKSPEFGDLGIAAPFVAWVNVADQTFSQEPHPRRERAAVLMRGDDGIAFPVVVPLPIWFETTPALVRYRGFRSPEFGDSGIVAPFVNWVRLGFEESFAPDRFARVRLGGALLRGDDGTQAVTPVYEPLGFEETFATDVRVRRERAGAVLRGDDGIAFPLPRPLIPWWETPVPLTYHRVYHSPETGEPGIASPFVRFTALEWPPPPMHRNPTRRLAGGVFRGDDGNYVQTQIVLPFVAWPEPPMYRNPTPWRAGAIARGDEGVENVLPPFVVVPFGWWDDRLDTYRKPPNASARAAATKHRMTFPVFPQFRDYGFHVQPPQPPHPKRERSGSIQVGEPGVEAPAIRFQPYGWEVQPPQPPHPWREKRGMMLKGDEGTELFYIFNVVLPNVGWPEPPMHKRPTGWRGGAFMRGPDGTDAPQILFRPYGWEVPQPQPPHPRRERSGAIMLGDPGTQAAFIFLAPPQLGWNVQPWQPPHRGVERAGAILRGDEGIVRPFVRFFPYGWEVQPVQPPKWPRTFREGAVALGDPGTQAPFQRFFPLLQEHTPALFFRRPQARVPVFLLQSVESYATFVAPHPPASAHTEITAFSAATTIGRMEIELIIEAFKATTVITRKDT